MREDTIVKYDRRAGESRCKQTHITADTWVAQVLDFAPTESRSWGFATVNIHANGVNGDESEIKATGHWDGMPGAFVSASIGGATVFLSPDQARTLALSLAKATGMMD